MTPNKNKLIIICTIIGAFVILSGCTSTTPSSSTVDERFVGNWVSDQFLGSNINFDFNSDEKVTITGDVTRSGTWNANGDTLTMSFNNETDGFTFSGAFKFEFSDSDNTLRINYGSVVLTLSKT